MMLLQATGKNTKPIE